MTKFEKSKPNVSKFPIPFTVTSRLILVHYCYNLAYYKAYTNVII